MIKQLALVLSLSLSVLQPNLSTLSLPLLNSKLGEKIFVFFLHGPQGLLSLKAKVGFVFDIVPSLFNPFLGHKNLLGDLHKNNIAIVCE